MYVKVRGLPPGNGWSLFGEFDRVDWDKEAFIDESTGDFNVYFKKRDSEDNTYWEKLTPDIIFADANKNMVENTFGVPTTNLVKKVVLIKGVCDETVKQVIVSDVTTFIVTNKGETIEKIR